jgi:hypothetical protein
MRRTWGSRTGSARPRDKAWRAQHSGAPALHSRPTRPRGNVSLRVGRVGGCRHAESKSDLKGRLSTSDAWPLMSFRPGAMSSRQTASLQVCRKKVEQRPDRGVPIPFHQGRSLGVGMRRRRGCGRFAPVAGLYRATGGPVRSVGSFMGCGTVLAVRVVLAEDGGWNRLRWLQDV